MLFLTSGVTCSSNNIFLIFMSLQCMLPQIKSISNILDRCCCSECTLSYYKATSFTLGFDVIYLNNTTKATCFDQLKDVSKYINMTLQESKKCNLKKIWHSVRITSGVVGNTSDRCMYVTEDCSEIMRGCFQLQTICCAMEANSSSLCFLVGEVCSLLSKLIFWV